MSDSIFGADVAEALGALIRKDDDKTTLKKNEETFVANTEFFGMLQESRKNFVYSPFSLIMALALLHKGATGESKKQLEEAFDFDKFSVLESLKMSGDLINRGENTIFSNNNAFWLFNKESGLKEDYAKFIEENCDKVVLNEPPTQETLDDINGWVNKATKGKIPSIIDEFPDFVRFVLLNAIYFKGKWEEEFTPFHSKVPFTNWNGTTTEVALIENNFSCVNYMHTGEDFGGMQIFSVPYKDHTANLTIFYPDEGYDNDDMNNAMGAYFRGELDHNTEWVDLRFLTPEFDVGTDIDKEEAIPMLCKMGVSKIFNILGGSLENITDEPDLYVNEIAQKAAMSLDRKGTVAAAATCIVGCVSGCYSPEVRKRVAVILKRPFAFAITDGSKKMPLMLGRKVEI